MTEERHQQLFDELLEAACCRNMSAVLSVLSNEDLEAMHEDLLEQFGQELAVGALDRSEWCCGKLLIVANQPSIGFLQHALQVVRSVIEQRRMKAAIEEASALSGRVKERKLQ